MRPVCWPGAAARAAVWRPFPLLWWALALGAVCCGIARPAAAEEDTELRLNQSIERGAEQREQELLEDERDAGAGLPKLIVDGREYDVAGDVNAMGRALYIAIKRKAWPEALTLLRAYRELDGADPMLVRYAQGGLARARGNLAAAEYQYRRLLGLQAGFLPGRLELARVLFERHKNREALRRFEGVRADLPPGREKTAGVRRSVARFIQALEHRRAWQGRVAAGPAYDDNINQSSESYTCLLRIEDGTCAFDREVPDGIGAYGTAYETTLEKRFFLSGHNSVFVRALGYGDIHDGHHERNQGTLTASAGYRYRDANDLYALAPLYELGRYGGDALYDAWGVRAEWMHDLSVRAALKLEGDFKDMQYRRHRHYDGGMLSLYATSWYRLPGGWTVFGGLDLADKSGDEAIYAYRCRGVRLGFSRPFRMGVRATLFASLRRRQYDAFNPILEARRRDDEQNYTLIIKAPRLAYRNVVPTLTYEHTRVESNVDWLYSYDRNAVSLKLEYQF